MKDNADYHVTQVLTDKSKKKSAVGVIKEQYITIGFKDDDKEEKRMNLRRDSLSHQRGPELCIDHKQLYSAGSANSDDLQEPMDDRIALQTDHAKLSAEIFLRR